MSDATFEWRDRAGETRGPSEVAELRALWADGDIDAHTLVLPPGGDWKAISLVEGLQARLTAARKRASAAHGRRSSSFLIPVDMTQLGPMAPPPLAEMSASGSEEEEEEGQEGKEEEQDAAKNSEWVWLRDQREAFVPVKIVERSLDGQQVTVQTVKKQLLTAASDEIAFPIRDISSIDLQSSDLVQMEAVNDATILQVLRLRYRTDTIYTNVGDILVAINPFKHIPLYTPEVVQQYVAGMRRRTEELEPHVFVIANAAYANMLEDEVNQSILISGESGAGKTESTKQCLNFLSTVAGGGGGGGVSDVASRILAANPILEGFGNAKTLRNNNSSRFGKFMEVKFNHHGKIVGCRVSSYLLEKSRIVTQMPSERNYHIFYQLCAGVTDQHRAHLELTVPEEYSFLSQSGCVSIPGMDDAEDFAETDRALSQLGFSEAEKQSLYEVTAAVLHLGNVRFASDAEEGSRLAGLTDVALAARLLQVPAENLTARLVHRSMDIRGETVTLDLNPEQAADGRNALAKGLYGKMFDWLVARVNDAMLGGGGKVETTFIGLLDIFGFEIFDTNSFEQLCINYCNEKLQQEFNEHTFRVEQQTYRDEGIEFPQVHYIDNQPVLDLLDKKPSGVLPLLDDEIVVPKATDETFLKKLQSAHKGTDKFATPRGQASLTSFVVRHYAGDVTYAVTGFLDKNKDRLFEDLAHLMRSSHSDFIRGLFAEPEAQPARRGRQPTQGAQFKRQLDDLMATTRATYPHYIRCIKPNAQKVAEVFDSQLVLQQLRYSGVFEAVTIRKSGFPFRLEHAEFFRRFRLLEPTAVAVQPEDKAVGCRELIRALGRSNETLGLCRVGRTMVLWRAEQHVHLEAGRAVVWQRACQKTSRFIRGCLARLLAEQLRAALPPLQAALDSRDVDTLERALEAAAPLMRKFKLRQAAQAEELVARLREEERLERELAEVVHTDPDLNFDQFHGLMLAAERIGMRSQALEDARAMYNTVAERRLAKKGLVDACAAADVEVLRAALDVVSRLKQSYGEFCAGEEQEARTMMLRIQRETQLVSALRSTVEAGRLKRKGNQLLAEEGAVGALNSAIGEVKRANVCTAEGRLFLAIGEFLLQLRRAVQAAAAAAESLDTRWHDVARVVAEEVPALSRVDARSMFEEVALVQEELSVRDAACDVSQKLQYAVQSLDEEWLVFALDQAERMQLVELGSERLQETIALGQQTLRYLAATKAALREAVAQTHMLKLERALQMADAISYESSLVSRARVLHLKGNKLVGEAATAITRMDRQEMWRVLEACTAMALEAPEVTAIRELLALSEHEFLHRELKAALELKDLDLLVAATTSLKQTFLRQTEGLFRWRAYHRLRRPEDFGVVLGQHRPEAERGMTTFTSQSLHTSLTLLPPGLTKLAVSMFNYVLGVQGLRPYSHRAVLAGDVLRMGVQHPALRDELYCLLMKQLSGCPPEEELAAQRAWALFFLATAAFPPSHQLENYIEAFLRTAGQEDTVAKLHRTIYLDTPEVPPMPMIERVLS